MKVFLDANVILDVLLSRAIPPKPPPAGGGFDLGSAAVWQKIFALCAAPPF